MSQNTSGSHRDIFLSALDVPEGTERESMLDQACGGDRQLRAQFARLLDAHESADEFLEISPWTGKDEETQQFQGDATSPSETSGLQAKTPEVLAELRERLAPCATPGSIGLLDHYEIIEIIGRGGMGVVLKALDTRLKRPVAIKLISADLAINDEARQRFLREARAAAAVRHDHVVTIHAVEELRGCQYLVMEIIEGSSLQQQLRLGQPFTTVDVLRIGAEIAEGLAAAHRAGLVHRDIKPGNILLQGETQRVKITDFGLARSDHEPGITHTGQIAGTPEYMAPEQAQGIALDERADLFSLGCVLYAMCAGQSPFHAKTALAAMRRVCDERPESLATRHEAIPPGLHLIIQRLLEKDPADRFQTAEEVAQGLRAELLAFFAASAPTAAFNEAVPASRSARQTRAKLAWAAGLLATLFGVSEMLGWTHAMQTVVRVVRGDGVLTIEALDPSVEVRVQGNLVTLDEHDEHRVGQTVLPPGDYVVQEFRNGNESNRQTVVMTRNGRETVRLSFEPTAPPVEIPGQTLDKAARWSPPTRVDTLGEEGVIRGRPAISGDGLILVFESDAAGGIGELDLWMSVRAALDEPFPRAVNLGAPVNSRHRDSDPSLSPDGLTLIFASRRPEGRLANHDIWIATRSSRSEAFGPPSNLGREVNSFGIAGGPALSADGLTLLFSSSRAGGYGQGDLWMATRAMIDEPFGEAVNLGPHINSPGRDSGPCLSADGLELWFASDRNPTLGSRDLWRCRRASLQESFGPPQNVGFPVNSSGDEESPTFTADGRVLLFESNRIAPDGRAIQAKTLESIWLAVRSAPNPDSAKDQP